MPPARAFQVFAIDGFETRMAALCTTARPWLERVGAAVSPVLAAELGEPIFPHVARHARRTVNPPDDTWVAFGPDKRGYKKDRHFKVAISKAALRLLFEVGPEYPQKAEWAEQWRARAPSLRSRLAKADLAWFRNEHDEEPAGLLAPLGAAELAGLAEGFTTRRDGQLVLGRRVRRSEALRLHGDAFADLILETFRALAPCYLLSH